MVQLYANRIEREARNDGAFTIDNVPGLWNAATLAELKKRGLDGYGQQIAKEAE